MEGQPRAALVQLGEQLGGGDAQLAPARGGGGGGGLGLRNLGAARVRRVRPNAGEAVVAQLGRRVAGGGIPRHPPAAHAAAAPRRRIEDRRAVGRAETRGALEASPSLLYLYAVYGIVRNPYTLGCRLLRAGLHTIHVQ